MRFYNVAVVPYKIQNKLRRDAHANVTYVNDLRYCSWCSDTSQYARTRNTPTQIRCRARHIRRAAKPMTLPPFCLTHTALDNSARTPSDTPDLNRAIIVADINGTAFFDRFTGRSGVLAADTVLFNPPDLIDFDSSTPSLSSFSSLLSSPSSSSSSSSPSPSKSGCTSAAAAAAAALIPTKNGCIGLFTFAAASAQHTVYVNKYIHLTARGTHN